MSKTIYTKDMLIGQIFHPGEHIKDELEDYNLTQKQLAEKLGIKPSVMSELVNGKRNVTAALAIKLENFNASSSNCNTILNWNTSNEINTEFFIVEQSFDAVNFHAVATVMASGSSFGHNYNLSVSQPTGVSYYRLKMKDNDGLFTYSSIVSCRNNCVSYEYMIVYPNPVSAYEKFNFVPEGVAWHMTL